MLNLEWILSNTEKVKNVIASVMAEETAEDIEDMKVVAQEGVEVIAATVEDVKRIKAVALKSVGIAFDLLYEPFKEAGYDLAESRGVPSQEAEEARQQLEIMQNEE